MTIHPPGGAGRFGLGRAALEATPPISPSTQSHRMHRTEVFAFISAAGVQMFRCGKETAQTRCGRTWFEKWFSRWFTCAVAEGASRA